MNSSKRSLLLLLLAFVNFTNIVDSMLIMPLGDIFIELYDLTATQYSLLVTAYAIAASISALIGFFIVDKFDRKRVLLFIYVGFALGTIGCAFASSYVTLTAIRFFTGLFGGMISATLLSIISDLYPFKERGKALGALFAAFSAASALGVPIGLYLADKGEWQLPFEVLGSLALVVAMVIAWLMPTMTDHITADNRDRSMRQTITSITSDGNQVKALTAGFFLILAHFIIIPFISPYMIRNVGLTQSQITYQFLFGGLATVVTSPLLGRLTDKIGAMKVFVVVMLLSWIPTFIITNLTVVPLAVALTYTTMFFVLGSGRMISPNTLITAAAPVANRGSFMSIKSSLQQLAIAAAAFVSGQLIYIGPDGLYHGYNYVGYLSIGLGVIAIFMVGRIKVAEGN
jgi:predicted MFS family arabinose efflux permease